MQKRMVEASVNWPIHERVRDRRRRQIARGLHFDNVIGAQGMCGERLTADRVPGPDGDQLRREAIDGLRAEIHPCLIGLGALGNEVAKNLCLLGVQRITLVDPDVVEQRNLDRSIFFRASECLGIQKTAAVKDAIASWFPSTNVRAFGMDVGGVGFDDLRPCNILFSCVDSDLARLEIAYIARRLSIPVIDAGLGDPVSGHGRITFFGPGTSDACFGCMLSTQRRRELLEHMGVTAVSCSPNGEVRSNRTTSAPLASLTAALQVEAGLRLFHERASSSSLDMRWFPSPGAERVNVFEAATCPFHEWPDELYAAPAAADDTSVLDLLDSADGETLIFDWPICAGARCETCGQRWHPMQRAMHLRLHPECPNCSSSHVTETEVLHSVGRQSAWASHKLAALGQPERHLYTIRRGARNA